jgi:hypothetical protein
MTKTSKLLKWVSIISLKGHLYASILSVPASAKFAGSLFPAGRYRDEKGLSTFKDSEI